MWNRKEQEWKRLRGRKRDKDEEVSTNMEDVAYVCRTCVGRVTTWRTCVRRVKNVQQTTVEKFEKVYKNSSERKSRRGKKPQIWFYTWRTCVGRATKSV